MERLTNVKIAEVFKRGMEGKFTIVTIDERKNLTNIAHYGPKLPEIYCRLGEIENILGDEYDLEDLKRMKEQKEKGLLFVLPVPIGSTVYTVVESYNGVFGRVFEIREEKFRVEMLPEIGKTVFTDWEEAVEAAGKMYRRGK